MTPDQIAAVVVALAMITISISFLHEVQKSKEKVCRDEGHDWGTVCHTDGHNEASYYHRCKRCGCHV